MIINYLSRWRKFRLFAVGKKSLEVLNFHFGRKYHFVKNEKLIYIMFLLLFCVDVFTESSIVSTPVALNLGEKPNILIDVSAMEKS